MIYARADARRLAVARIALLAAWLVDVARDPFTELWRLPRAWFSGYGPWAIAPAALVDLLWNAPALWVLKLATLGCVAAAMLGLPGARRWTIAAAALLTVLTAFVRGFGHADHAHVQLLLVTYLLPCLPAWDAFRLARQRAPARDGDAPSYAGSFAALAVVFAFPYLLTGLYRVMQEGVPLYFGPSMKHFIVRDILSLDYFDSTLGLTLVEQPYALPLLNAGFAAVTAAELAAPLAHLRRGATLAWLALILPFHLLGPPLMHVLFPHNIWLLCVLYVWPLTWRARGAGG